MSPATRPLVILAYPKIDHEKNYVYYWMPFSVLSIGKQLLADGLADVVLFDGNQHDMAAWQSLLDTHLHRTKCIGLSIMTGGGQIRHALQMAAAAKARPGCPAIVFGGPHVNVLPEQTLQHPLVDAVLVGPGQSSMPHFVRALQGHCSLDAVPGLLLKRGDQVLQGVENPPRVRDLGGYAWHLLDVESYIRDDPTVAPRTLNYVSSQGCVYKCRFCYELTYQRKYSQIAAPSLLDDVEALVRDHNVGGVKFYDADWFINLRRAVSFSRGLLERSIHINWAASLNPNDVLRARRVEPDMLRLAAKSGCRRLLMGAESGSDRVLREIVHKGITREQILDVASEIASHGILGSYTFIVGFPGETDSEQSETYSLIEHLWQLSPTPETRVHLFAPYPGTPLFDVAVAHGFSPPSRLEEWARYDYYDSQTPWTSQEMVAKVRQYTRMRLMPASAAGTTTCPTVGGASTGRP